MGGRDSTPSERSERSINTARSGLAGWSTPSKTSEPRWTAWRSGESEAEYYLRHGRQPPMSPSSQESERQRLERYRAEQMAAGKKIYCPECRSGSIKYLADGSFQCVGRSRKRGSPSCYVAGITTVFTNKQAIAAGKNWVQDIRTRPE